MSDINKPEFLQAGLPSLGGAGSASALAKFYGLLISKKENRFIPRSVKQLLGRSISSGNDLTLLVCVTGGARCIGAYILESIATTGGMAGYAIQFPILSAGTHPPAYKGIVLA